MRISLAELQNTERKKKEDKWVWGNTVYNLGSKDEK